MTRVTKKDIYRLEGRINDTLERNGYSRRVKVQWAYGQPRAYYYIDDQQVGMLSPRLPTGEIYKWLSAYRAGLCLGLNKGNA